MMMPIECDLKVKFALFWWIIRSHELPDVPTWGHLRAAHNPMDRLIMMMMMRMTSDHDDVDDDAHNPVDRLIMMMMMLMTMLMGWVFILIKGMMFDSESILGEVDR